jgi:hypothetical protein
MRTRIHFQSLIAGLLLLGGASSTGCSTLALSADDLFGADETKAGVTTSPGTDGPTIAIEFYPTNGQPERAFLPLESVTYVQDVLERTNAHRKFARIKIRIHRELPNGSGHKFDVQYDRKYRRIQPGFDYALHPGDRLQIIEDPTNALDDMLQSIGGPLSGALPF